MALYISHSFETFFDDKNGKQKKKQKKRTIKIGPVFSQVRGPAFVIKIFETQSFKITAFFKNVHL